MKHLALFLVLTFSSSLFAYQIKKTYPVNAEDCLAVAEVQDRGFKAVCRVDRHPVVDASFAVTTTGPSKTSFQIGSDYYGVTLEPQPAGYLLTISGLGGRGLARIRDAFTSHLENVIPSYEITYITVGPGTLQETVLPAPTDGFFPVRIADCFERIELSEDRLSARCEVKFKVGPFAIGQRPVERHYLSRFADRLHNTIDLELSPTLDGYTLEMNSDKEIRLEDIAEGLNRELIRHPHVSMKRRASFITFCRDLLTSLI